MMCGMIKIPETLIKPETDNLRFNSDLGMIYANYRCFVKVRLLYEM